MPRCTIRVRNARQSISSWSDTFSIPIEEEQFESYKDTSFNKGHFERLFKFQLRKKKSAYLQFEPDGQSESLQHSRHLLKGHTPQQFPESHWLSLLHFPPFGLPETWFSNKINKTQITRNIGRNIMIPCTFDASIKKKRKVFRKYKFEIEHNKIQIILLFSMNYLTIPFMRIP